MGKGVGKMVGYFQVGQCQANNRYLEALAQVQQRGKTVKELDGLCQPVAKDGKRYAKLQRLSRTRREVYREVVSTNHVIHGMRNRDVRQALHGSSEGVSQEQARRRCSRVSRILGKFWAHGLVFRVRNANLYRATLRGYRIMSSVLAFHHEEFAQGYAKAL